MRKQEGLHSLCSNYVNLYSSFLNIDGQIIVVCHNNYVSTFSLRYLRWMQHFVFPQPVRYVFSSKVDSQKVDEIGLLLGFNQFMFMKFNSITQELSKHVPEKIIVLDSVVTEIVSDHSCPGEAYFICENMILPQVSPLKKKRSSLRVSPSLPDEPKKFSLMAMIKGEKKELIGKDRSELDDLETGYRLWLTKAAKVRMIWLDYFKKVGDKKHFQIRVNVAWPKFTVENVVKYEIEYPPADKKFKDKVTDNEIPLKEGKLVGYI
jgi:hypothetical protein